MGVEDKWHKNRIFHQSIHLTINDMHSKRWKMEDRNALFVWEEGRVWKIRASYTTGPWRVVQPVYAGVHNSSIGSSRPSPDKVRSEPDNHYWKIGESLLTEFFVGARVVFLLCSYILKIVILIFWMAVYALVYFFYTLRELHNDHYGLLLQVIFQLFGCDKSG